MGPLGVERRRRRAEPPGSTGKPTATAADPSEHPAPQPLQRTSVVLRVGHRHVVQWLAFNGMGSLDRIRPAGSNVGGRCHADADGGRAASAVRLRRARPSHRISVVGADLLGTAAAAPCRSVVSGRVGRGGDRRSEVDCAADVPEHRGSGILAAVCRSPDVGNMLGHRSPPAPACKAKLSTVPSASPLEERPLGDPSGQGDGARAPFKSRHAEWSARAPRRKNDGSSSHAPA